MKWVAIFLFVVMVSVGYAVDTAVPTVDGTGGMGTSSKSWLEGYFGNFYATNTFSLHGTIITNWSDIPLSETDPIWSAASNGYARAFTPVSSSSNYIAATPILGVADYCSSNAPAVDLSGYVEKAGDTMTGALVINTDHGLIISSLSSNISIGIMSTSTLQGVAVGAGANATLQGVAVGNGAKAVSGSVAIGGGANAGNNFSTAVGYNTDGNTYGVALGNGADGQNHGVALGYRANSVTRSIAVGDNANGTSYGTALGYYCKAITYGIGVGAYANGSTYGIAMGNYSKAVSNSVAIGTRVTNAVAGSWKINGDGILGGSGTGIYFSSAMDVMIYSETGELYAVDNSANVTEISPHGWNGDPTIPVHNSINDLTGKRVTINLLAVAEALRDMGYTNILKVIQETPQSWADREQGLIDYRYGLDMKSYNQAKKNWNDDTNNVTAFPTEKPKKDKPRIKPEWLEKKGL